jgi:phosphogluconate dehydratase
LARIADGDMLRLDAQAGRLDCLTEGFASRAPVVPDLSANAEGSGRALFEVFRRNVGAADAGASAVL